MVGDLSVRLVRTERAALFSAFPTRPAEDQPLRGVYDDWRLPPRELLSFRSRAGRPACHGRLFQGKLAGGEASQPVAHLSCPACMQTRPCWQFMRHGSCSAGDTCRHAHGFKELRTAK